MANRHRSRSRTWSPTVATDNADDNEISQHSKGKFYSARELTVEDTAFLRERGSSRLSHYGGSTSSDDMDMHLQLSPTTPVPVIRITPVPSPQLPRRLNSGSLSPFKVLPRISTSSRSASEESLTILQQDSKDNLYLYADNEDYQMRIVSPPPTPPSPTTNSSRRRLIRANCVDYTDNQVAPESDHEEIPVRPKTPHKDTPTDFPFPTISNGDWDTTRPKSPSLYDPVIKTTQVAVTRPKSPCPADSDRTKTQRQSRSRPKTPCPDVRVAVADDNDMIELDIDHITAEEDVSVTGNDILMYSVKPAVPSPMRRFARPLTPSPPSPAMTGGKSSSLLARRRHRTVAGHRVPTYLLEEGEHTPMLAPNSRSISSHELYGFDKEMVELNPRPMSTLSSPAIALFPPDSHYGQHARKKLSKSESNISTSSNDSGYSN